MKILGIETSTKMGSLVLVEDGSPVAGAEIDTRRKQSSRLIPVLDKLLRGAGWQIDELDGVGVGLGPGSFTGIRVGLAAGQGLAFGVSIPLVGIGSFPAMVRGSSAPDGPVTVLMAGGPKRIYGGGYRKSGDNIEEIIPPKVISSGELEEMCRGSWIVSPRGERWKKELEEGEITGGENSFPRARWIAILAEEKIKLSPVNEIETAAPIYLSQYWR